MSFGRKKERNAQGKVNQSRLNKFIGELSICTQSMIIPLQLLLEEIYHYHGMVGGRIALRRAFKTLIIVNGENGWRDVHHLAGDGVVNNTVVKPELPPLLSDRYGAPTVPLSVCASISHKDDMCVGVAKLDSDGRIGVDLEHCNNKAASTLMRRVITENEQRQLGQIDGVSAEEEVLLR